MSHTGSLPIDFIEYIGSAGLSLDHIMHEYSLCNLYFVLDSRILPNDLHSCRHPRLHQTFTEPSMKVRVRSHKFEPNCSLVHVTFYHFSRWVREDIFKRAKETKASDRGCAQQQVIGKEVLGSSRKMKYPMLPSSRKQCCTGTGQPSNFKEYNGKMIARWCTSIPVLLSQHDRGIICLGQRR